MATVEDRVASGAYLLDLHAPGWRDKIDLDRLDTESCVDCIVGQVFGEFAKGMVEMGLWSEDSPPMIHQAMLGFAIDTDNVDADLALGYHVYSWTPGSRAFARLNAAWRNLLVTA